MNRVEKFVISIFIALICPITLFVLLWWSTSALAMSGVLKIQEDTIIYSSLLGLGIGILISIFYLREIRARFYDIGYIFLIPIYLFWSAIALAFSMGTPFGNLLLGILAGLYAGRRFYYQGTIGQDLRRNARTIGIFTAIVTGIESLFMGFLGLQEQFIIELLQSRFDLDHTKIFGPLGVGLVVSIVIIIMSIQYICTKTAFWTAVKVGKR